MSDRISAVEARRLREAAEEVAHIWGHPDPPDDDLNAADRMWFVAMDAADDMDRLAASVERLEADNQRLRAALGRIAREDYSERHPYRGPRPEPVRIAAVALSDEEET